MADNFPTFPFVTEEDWYGEVTFISAEDNQPISLAGRNFVMLITPAGVSKEPQPPAILLSNDPGGGLELKNGDPSTIIFRARRDITKNLPRQEYTANIYELSGTEQYLFLPMRIQYSDPSGLRLFLSRFLGVKVSFSKRLQPIVTPVPITGREGKPGNTILYGAVPPVPADGKDGDFYIEDRTASGQGRRMYGPRAGGQWPPTPWNIQVAGLGDVPGLIGALAGKANNGIVYVGENGRECISTDVVVAVSSLPHPIAVYLPEATQYFPGQVLTIVDVTGTCSYDNHILIYTKPGSNDVIAGADSNLIVLDQPYFPMKFIVGNENLWVRY